jgi:membrane-associated phospholipid phosphatase
LIKAVTALGTEVFYIPVILLIFWCVDEKKGIRLGFLIILSAFANGFFKALFKQPRPYNLEPPLGLASESSFGFPSAHAQVSLCFWLPCASWFYKRKAAAYGTAIGITAIIGFTRLYLGVHFPTDLLGGWLLGALILGIYYNLMGRIITLLNEAGMRGRMIAVAVIAFGMNALLPAERSFGALFLGFGVGYNLMLKHIPFSARAGWDKSGRAVLKRLGRYALGLAGVYIIYRALYLVLPGETSLFKDLPYWGGDSPYYELGRFIRYGFIGLWAAAGAPWLFLRLGFADQGEKS